MTSNLQIELPLLTFNSLYNLLREEKKVKALKSLPELFYESLNYFLNEKRNQIKKLKEDSELKKLQKEKLILKNSKKIATELTNLRCIKISNIAIKNELFEEEILPISNILEKELIFFESVKESVKKLKI